MKFWFIWLSYTIFPCNGIYENLGYISNIRNIKWGFDSYDTTYDNFIIIQVKRILITKFQIGEKLGVMEFELCDA